MNVLIRTNKQEFVPDEVDSVTFRISEKLFVAVIDDSDFESIQTNPEVEAVVELDSP